MNDLLAPSKSIHIMIVDDDFNQITLLKECLKIAGGFCMESVENLSTFWAKINANDYDIILMDNCLPDGTGLDTLEQLKTNNNPTPVIIITGLGDEQLAVKAMHLGAADYLVKGTNYWGTLPDLIRKTVEANNLQQAIGSYQEQIRYQALLLNNMRDAVVVWDTHGNIKYWNRFAELILGLSGEDSLTKNIQDFYIHLFQPPVPFPLEGITIPGEVERKVDRNGKEIWVSSRITPLRDLLNDNQLIGYIDVLRDITSRKVMMDLIHQTQLQLNDSYRQSAIGDLASSVAHHINNPLTTIIAESQILSEALPSGHPCTVSAKAIEKAGWRVQKAVQQLIDLSQATERKMSLVSINDTLRKAVELIKFQIYANQVDLNIELAENLPLLMGDAQKLTALWINLLILARDGTVGQPAAKIEVTSKLSASGAISVNIRDNGKLIPLDKSLVSTEPDFNVDLAGRGTDVELTICLEIIRQHSAEMRIDSAESSGTCFEVKFPAENAYE